MIHQYKLGGYNIVLDVCSGAVHVVDDIAYDLIAGYESKTRGELISEIAEKYCGTECGSTADAVTISDIYECYDQITELKIRASSSLRIRLNRWRVR